MAKRAKRGTVSVEVIGDRIRLRFRHQGKQVAFHPGITNTIAGRTKATLISKQIEIDLLSDRFDESLDRYKVHSNKNDGLATTTLVSLFEDFIAVKSETCDSRTLTKYRPLLNQLTDCGLGGIDAYKVSPTHVKKLVDYLRGRIKSRTQYCSVKD